MRLEWKAPISQMPKITTTKRQADTAIKPPTIESVFAAQRETAVALRTSTAAMRIEKIGLLVGPLTSATAARCPVILKPAEISEVSWAVIARMSRETFEPE
jgi:hypothetical protein